MNLCWPSMSLLFNMLSRFLIAFLPRSNHPLISWLESPSAVILEPKKIKSVTVSIVSPLLAMKWWDWMPLPLFFECWVLSQFFHSLLPPSSRGSLSSSHEVAKVLEFQLQYQAFKVHPGLISFRMDWLDLIAVQGILKSLFQHHSSKVSILWHSAFLIVQF